MWPAARAKLIAGDLDVVLITSGVGAVLFVVVLSSVARDGVTLW